MRKPADVGCRPAVSMSAPLAVISVIRSPISFMSLSLGRWPVSCTRTSERKRMVDLLFHGGVEAATAAFPPFDERGWRESTSGSEFFRGRCTKDRLVAPGPGAYQGPPRQEARPCIA